MLLFVLLSACLYGGGSRRDQIDLVSSGLEIVIGKFVMFNGYTHVHYLYATA